MSQPCELPVHTVVSDASDVMLTRPLVSFCRETKNITSNQAFASFSSLLFIFLLTRMCVLWHT
jgi:hypothetical protein